MRRCAAWLVGLACAALVSTGVFLPADASGAGQTYEIVQCDPVNRGVSGVALDDAPSYAVKQMCGEPQEDHAIKIDNIRFAQHGRSGRVKWSTRSPSLRIVGAEVQASCVGTTDTSRASGWRTAAVTRSRPSREA